ncbi:MAG: tyrosine--tRNA ligase [Patescibacteria group bacterium]
MIRAEAYKQRLDRQEGLSFIEFNYQILQAYDFLTLFDKHNCSLQLGGDDQWGNILAGVDLVRRVRNKKVYGLTFPLLTTANGNKMGKTESGAIWLDSEKTSPYEFYQYWINTDDRDVARFLNYFTFLSQEEILSFKKDSSVEIRKAKEILAFEATKLTHGEEEAVKAKNATSAVFANTGDCADSVPTTEIDAQRIKKGVPIVDLLCEIAFSKTKSEARRLIDQGGICLNGERVVSADLIVGENFVKNSIILIRRGKKQYRRIVFKGELQ